MYIRNSKGISLVSTMIAVGILSGLSLVIMQVSTNAFKIKKRAVERSDARMITHQVTQTMLSIKNCNLNFEHNSFPRLVNESKIFKEIVKDSNIEISTIIDTSVEKEKNGIIVNAIKLLVSKTDALNSGMTFVEHASRDIHGYGELQLEFGKNKLSKNIETGVTERSFKKLFHRNIPIFLNLDSENKFRSCYATAFNEMMKDAIANAVKRSCGNGLKYNEDNSNPECIPEFNTKKLVSCPDGKSIINIEMINVDEEIKYHATCSPENICTEDQIGIWIGDKMSCVKCESDQHPTLTTEGIKCVNLNCSNSSEIQYLAGIDSKSGEKICKTLVDGSNLNCGENGFKLLVTSSEGSVKGKCCQDCPEASNICKGNLVGITSDCNIQCSGKLERQSMTYSEWGACSPRNGGSICFQTRTGNCKTFDAEGFPCCDGGQQVKTVEKICSTGQWETPTCPDSNDNENLIIEPICTTECCDPSTRPDTIKCIMNASTSGGSKESCETVKSGELYKFNGKIYCKTNFFCNDSQVSKIIRPWERVQESLPDEKKHYWKAAYVRYGSNGGKGDAHGGNCTGDTCGILSTYSWKPYKNGDPIPSCTYYAMKTHNPHIGCIKSNPITIYAPIQGYLCE